MGKTSKGERGLPDRDAFVRMNFLHQAAHLALATAMRKESMPHTVCDGDASAAASDAASAGDEVLNTGASDGVSESREGSCVKDVGAVDAAGDLSSVAENTVDEESAATRHRRQRGRSAGKVPADGAKTMRTMSRVYVAEMKNIAKRLVLRMIPTIKREVCKGCGTLLVPGATAQVRVRAKRDTHVVVTCTTCNRLRRFLNRPGHHLHHSVEVVHTVTSPAMFAASDADTVAPGAVASEAGAALSEPKALNQQTQDVDDEAYAQEMRDAHTDREGDDVI